MDGHLESSIEDNDSNNLIIENKFETAVVSARTRNGAENTMIEDITGSKGTLKQTSRNVHSSSN